MSKPPTADAPWTDERCEEIAIEAVADLCSPAARSWILSGPPKAIRAIVRSAAARAVETHGHRAGCYCGLAFCRDFDIHTNSQHDHRNVPHQHHDPRCLPGSKP